MQLPCPESPADRPVGPQASRRRFTPWKSWARRAGGGQGGHQCQPLPRLLPAARRAGPPAPAGTAPEEPRLTSEGRQLVGTAGTLRRGTCKGKRHRRKGSCPHTGSLRPHLSWRYGQRLRLALNTAPSASGQGRAASSQVPLESCTPQATPLARLLRALFSLAQFSIATQRL